MKFLSGLFLVSLLLGQIGGIPVYPGVVIYIHDIVLAMLLAASIVRYAAGRKFVKPKLMRPIIFFIAAAFCSLLANFGRFAIPSLEVSALYLVRWAFYGIVYVLVLQTYIKKEFWLYGVYAAGVAFGFLGLIQFFLYPDLRNLSYLGWDPHFYRLFGTFLDPNFAGIFLVLTFLLGFYLWGSKKIRVWIGIGEAVSLICLLLTYSRSSYLAFIGGIGIYAIFKRRRLFVLAAVTFILAAILFPKTPGSTLDLLRVDSTLARIGNWQESIRLIAQAPLFGHGFNTLRYVSPFGLDSSLLFVGATTGLVGLLAYIYLIFSMIRLGRDSVFYMASLAAIAIHSLFVNSAFYPWVMIWMWLLTGVIERSFDSKTRSG